MRCFLGYALLLFAAVSARANDYIEAFNDVSDGYDNTVQDTRLVRRINGGTIITPVFDASCPEEIKAPFAYACKILEEYMPPCLPLKVKVSCGRVNGSSLNAISKVRIRTIENFGWSARYKNAPMSMIKGVILADMTHEWTATYLDSVPDVGFLTKDPDIEITYNQLKLSEMSFSLNPEPGEKYDFVSLAIRDMFIGLGFSSSYRVSPALGILEDPVQEMLPFESSIDEALGDYGNPVARLANATKGELFLKYDATRNLRLYAPSTWTNGVSLNRFIPQADCCLSNILSYDFCRGMVTRSLEDNYSTFIFYDLLGWMPNSSSAVGGTDASQSGSTSLLMPYKGQITFDKDSPYGIATETVTHRSYEKPYKAKGYYENQELMDYIDSFHPYLSKEPDSEGTSVSILKKDGTWDLVFTSEIYMYGSTHDMNDWEFHFNEENYARTIDGYLRARVTLKSYNPTYDKTYYRSTFFVVDYLPQKVKLSYVDLSNKSASIEPLSLSEKVIDPDKKVRIYFSKTEGLNRLVLERLKEGFRLPSKIEITDFKKGYYETTIDRTTTFTAIGYNDNGTSRGEPIKILPGYSIIGMSNETFELSDNQIRIVPTDNSNSSYSYKIVSLNPNAMSNVVAGTTDGVIDISSLPEGSYVITVNKGNSAQPMTFKFKK